MRWRYRALGFALILTASLVATVLSNILLPSKTLATAAFLVPAPTQTVGHYDYFGKLLTPQQAAQLVRRRGLDASDPVSYQRICAVEINLDLLEKGENIFFSRKIGDTFGFQGVLGFGAGLATLKEELETAIAALGGEPTTNLSITLQKDINLGSRTFPKGLVFNTGFDMERGLKVPTQGISPTPTTLPFGLLPDGGYKTPSLRGAYLSAPYLHDGGVAMRAGSLEVASDGSFTVVDPSGVGLTGTLSQGIAADSASSLRALFDSKLRQQVVATNKANPALVRNNLDGSGHDFYVDKTTGFSPTKQTDLINFLGSIASFMEN